MRRRIGVGAILCSLFPACVGSFTCSRSDHWDGQLQVDGALRAIFHEGQTGAMVTLDSILPNPKLHAVGAMADLAGEITIIGGKAYLSYPSGANESRTEVTQRSTVGAALLVSTDVGSWKSVRSEHAIRFEDLDDEIAALAAAAGLQPGGRFPFLVRGELEDLEWHVIDGRRLSGGGVSHENHQAASVRTVRERANATLIGFYSENDHGIFTHMGSRTHVHCVLDEPPSSGHVDHVVIPAGTTVQFPVVTKR